MMEGPSLTAGLEILEMPSGSGETGLKEGGRWRLALLTGGGSTARGGWMDGPSLSTICLCDTEQPNAFLPRPL